MGQPTCNSPVTKLCLLLALALCPAALSGQTPSPALVEKPADASADWKQLLGTYAGEDKTVVEILESDGQLELKEGANPAVAILKDSDDRFAVADSVNGDNQTPIPVQFVRGGDGQKVREIIFGRASLQRRIYDADLAKSFHVTPVRTVEELRKEAMLASPPKEERAFRKPDLVELTTLDPSIHLDIRYATANNFLGTPVYTQPRAFLQRPAAEAMLRALRALKPYGYGLLIHDGYRPWYVTKIFWEATPQEGKIFVADPSQGSRHNRGCAVDLTLYDLKTGKPIEMPGTYDEMSPRSFPNYPGGTSLQRWTRNLLRHVMESEGFTVFETEWWHFDYNDWREYPLLNIPFEQLNLNH
jgi:D-alanyl-D-alanine dipeptidase